MKRILYRPRVGGVEFLRPTVWLGLSGFCLGVTMWWIWIGTVLTDVPISFTAAFQKGADQYLPFETDGGWLGVIVVVAVFCWRNFLVGFRAHKPGPVEVLEFSNATENHALSVKVLTNLFRENLEHNQFITAHSALPASPTTSSMDLVQFVQDKQVGTKWDALLSVILSVWPRVSYRITGTLLVREEVPQFGISLVISGYDYGIRPAAAITCWESNFHAAVEQAAHAAIALLLPYTNLGLRQPWNLWRGKRIPASLVSFHAVAQKLLLKNQYDEALDSYFAALELDPGNPSIRLDIANIQEKLGLFIDSVDTYFTIINTSEEPPEERRIQQGLARLQKEECRPPTSTERFIERWVHLGEPKFLWNIKNWDPFIPRYRFLINLGFADKLSRQWHTDGPSPRRNNERNALRKRLLPRLDCKYGDMFEARFGYKPHQFMAERARLDFIEPFLCSKLSITPQEVVELLRESSRLSSNLLKCLNSFLQAHPASSPGTLLNLLDNGRRLPPKVQAQLGSVMEATLSLKPYLRKVVETFALDTVMMNPSLSGIVSDMLIMAKREGVNTVEAMKLMAGQLHTIYNACGEYTLKIFQDEYRSQTTPQIDLIVRQIRNEECLKGEIVEAYKNLFRALSLEPSYSLNILTFLKHLSSFDSQTINALVSWLGERAQPSRAVLTRDALHSFMKSAFKVGERGKQAMSKALLTGTIGKEKDYTNRIENLIKKDSEPNRYLIIGELVGLTGGSRSETYPELFSLLNEINKSSAEQRNLISQICSDLAQLKLDWREIFAKSIEGAIKFEGEVRKALTQLFFLFASDHERAELRKQLTSLRRYRTGTELTSVSIKLIEPWLELRKRILFCRGEGRVLKILYGEERFEKHKESALCPNGLGSVAESDTGHFATIRDHVNSCLGRKLGRKLTNWLDNYNAACVYALGVNLETASVQATSDSFAKHAANHLIELFRGVDRTTLGKHRDWILVDDPDLDELRSTPEFKRVEMQYFNSKDNVSVIARELHQLRALRHVSEMFELGGRVMGMRWQARAKMEDETLVQFKIVLDWWDREEKVWIALLNFCQNTRHWPSRMQLISAINDGVKHDNKLCIKYRSPFEMIKFLPLNNNKETQHIDHAMECLAHNDLGPRILKTVNQGKIALTKLDLRKRSVAPDYPVITRRMCMETAAVWHSLSLWFSSMDETHEKNTKSAVSRLKHEINLLHHPGETSVISESVAK